MLVSYSRNSIAFTTDCEKERLLGKKQWYRAEIVILNGLANCRKNKAILNKKPRMLRYTDRSKQAVKYKRTPMCRLGVFRQPLSGNEVAPLFL